jgi:hypothetical protein
MDVICGKQISQNYSRASGSRTGMGSTLLGHSRADCQKLLDVIGTFTRRLPKTTRRHWDIHAQIAQNYSLASGSRTGSGSTLLGHSRADCPKLLDVKLSNSQPIIWRCDAEVLPMHVCQ